jgi:hypothetical protein
MRKNLMATLLLASALAGCATAQGMEHGGMGHAEMMRHCQMMEQHAAEGGHNATHHDPAQHGGMSHEEMVRHCAEMRGQQAGDEPPASHSH